jgi:hypothetical protein
VKKSFLNALITASMLTLVVTSYVHASPTTDEAAKKLENVINNNVPAENRAILQGRVDVIKKNLEELESAIKTIENVANNNVPKEYRDLLNQKITSLKQAIINELGGDLIAPTAPTPVISGYFCTRACRSFDGQANLQYSAGSSASDKIVASQGAIDALSKVYTCNAGSVEVGCESQGSDPKAFTCQFGCKNFSGTVDQGYTAIGQGRSELEAQQNAISALKSKYTCNVGIIKSACQKN